MRSELDRLMASSPESDPLFRSRFCVGGVSIEIAGDRRADVCLIPPLEPFRAETAVSDINIQVQWVAKLAEMSGRRVFDSGTTWRLYERGSEFQFDFNAPLFGEAPYKRLFVDTRFRRASLQMSEESLAVGGYTADPLGYPLDELLIMHRLTQEKAIELHGAGIVRANVVANLFVGHSGAGKSTTTRLWTDRENVEVLSDDRIIVRRDEDPSFVEMPCEAAGRILEHGVLRLRDRSASPVGHSAQDDRAEKQIPRSSRNDKGKMRMYGTPWHGEAMYASPNSAPLARIFVLEHGHGNVITPLTPNQAVAELFARSFVPFHRHEYVDSALVFLEELANAVPVYRYAFEPDQRAVEKIRNFHD